jgi:hypothetical protein
MKNRVLIILMTLLITLTFFPGCGDSEKKAKASFYKAQALIRDGKEDEGKKILNEVISKYPETKAAAEANEILNAMHATKALTKIFKEETIETYNQTAKIDLKTAGMAQQMYFIENNTYSKSIKLLIGSKYGFYIGDGVKISIKHADGEKFIMESFHEKGNKTYILTSDSEEPKFKGVYR